MSQTQKQNRLAQESSPYLLQHADNPVDWWPWGPQALQKAKQENKLILLSVGYSACHWCHVMAHESFEDPDTAAVMNQHYINIKVDREERPDLDKIYQTAHQLLNQRAGGWPLTMILSPEQHIPIFAGTYFPVTEKHGLPAFKDLLKHIDEFYQAHPDDIQQQNQSLMDALDAISQPNSEPGTPSSLPLDQARQQLAQQFDNTHAGFGKAPKFPHPSNLAFLLRYWLTSNANQNPDQQSLHMLRMSLHAMASGGIYDQLGGGFFRYAVDDYWMIPHFEKMLYDNGPLVSLYAQAYKTIGDSVFARIAQDTCQWVIDEMQSPQGGYYSTLDADAEGHEGKFYVWNKAEVQSLLDEPSFALFSKLFGFDRAANFEGQWHLHLYESLDTVATELGIDMDTAASQLQQAQQQLLAKRAQRIRPSRDEKILTSWNGLMIKGMAQAGHLLSQPQFIASAQQAVDFIQQHMFEDNRLFATYKDSQARLMAYLDDYAFLLDAALHLLQAAWQERHLQFAIALADTLLTHFEDTEQGGFYFTAHDHEQLIQRPKPLSDEAIPAGNAIAAQALINLGHLLGENRYIEAGERTLHYAWAALSHAPYAHASMLMVAETYLYPPEQIIIRGSTQDSQAWLDITKAHYLPQRSVYAIADDANTLPGLLAQRTHQEGKVMAYICQGTQCQAPITDLDAFTQYLQKELD